MYERLHAKKEELGRLNIEHQKQPELFQQKTFVDDAAMLDEFGIHIPGKEKFLLGALKLWPEDFIVEEIAKDGSVSHIFPSPAAETGAQTKVLTATLVKCNISTLEAIDDLARLLNIPKENIGYAGMKDKEAVTAQRISLRGVGVEQVEGAQSPFFFLKDARYGGGDIQRGALRGNRFTILVRTDVSLAESAHGEVLARALERVHEKGFYNFFYLQRFSIPRLRNYQWAYDILKGNYKEAVYDIITTETTRELSFFKNIRAELEKSFGKWSEMEQLIAPYPMTFVHELKIVRHLSAHDGDFAGALASIPDQITIWLNALGSLFFNKKISEYAVRGQEPPHELPFFLSVQSRDQAVYRELLQKYELWPIPFHNLAPFPFIKTKGGHSVPTIARAKILKAEVTSQGLLFEFELAKGQYATTFLSHVFNLLSGPLPPTVQIERIDSKNIFKEGSLGETLARFQSVTIETTETDLGQLLAKGD